MTIQQVVEDIVEVPVEVKVPYPVHVPVDQIVHVPHEVEKIVYRDVPVEKTVVHRDEVVAVPSVEHSKPEVNVGLGLGVGLLPGGKFPGKFPLLKKLKKVL